MNKKLNRKNRDIEILSERIEELERELSETRSSIAYRLSHIIRQAVYSPIRVGIFFPITIAKLIIEFLKIDKKNNDKNIVNGRYLRNRNNFALPGKDTYVSRLFPEAKLHKRGLNSTVRIATIASKKIRKCLEIECVLFSLSTSIWKEILINENIELLLVQSTINLGTEYNIREILSICNRKEIPTVFWDTDDHINQKIHLHYAKSFDYIFVADRKNVEFYSENTKKKVVFLGPAVQPALHNPLKNNNIQYTGFNILYDGWADILESPKSYKFLKKLTKYSLHVFESRFLLKTNKIADTPEYQENVIGCLSYERLISAYKYFRILIQPSISLSSNTYRHWQAIEALASGCFVISAGNSRLIERFNGIKNCSYDDDIVSVVTNEVCSETKRLKQVHLSRREIYASHTYSHRIRTICEITGIQHNWIEYPLVTVILSTKRPSLISKGIMQYENQTYPNKELIIVINSDSAEINSIQTRIASKPDIRLFQIHQEYNIGTCLNYAIGRANGTYWFKMDDDDAYGKNYLLDLMQLTQAADFHIFGKPKGFTYLEKDRNIYLSSEAIKSQYTIETENAPHIVGATLSGIRGIDIQFSVNKRASVDVDFQAAATKKGLCILTGDFWNFAAYRSSDKNHHTWREGDNFMKKNSIYMDKGENIDQIMI